MPETMPVSKTKTWIALIGLLAILLTAEFLAAQVQLLCYRQAVLKSAVEGKLTREWREARQSELEPAGDNGDDGRCILAAVANPPGDGFCNQPGCTPGTTAGWHS